MNTEFNPIQCTSQIFASLKPQEGFLYFVTDTKQLFLGKDGKFVNMCGGINIVYGEKYIEYVDSGQSPDPNVTFSVSELTVPEYPLVNDLILNEDGCFYKVNAIVDERIETTRVTLQGSGGGSSSGGGSASANLRINHSGGQNRYFSSQAKQAELGVVAYSDDAANYISTVELSWDDTFAAPFLTIGNLSYPLERTYYVDITKYLSKFSSKGTRVYLRVTDKYGSTRYIYYTVFIASLELVATDNSLIGAMEDEYEYRCTIGGSRDLESRTMIYEIYSDALVTPILTIERTVPATHTGPFTAKLDLSTLEHGDYTLKVRMVGAVSGTNIESNILTHKLLRYRESVGTALFSVLIPESTEQYSPFNIAYLLIYGNSTKTYTVKISIDNELKTSQSIRAGEINTYTFDFDTQGNYLLGLAIDELGISETHTLEITQYTGNLPVVDLTNENLQLYLTAKGRTNNAIDKEKWPDSKNPSLQANLNNFYYRTINGWMTDGEGVDYLKVTQNATVELPDFTPFSDEPKKNGLTIELDFMLDGIFDYDCHFIECLSYRDDNSIKTGFIVKGDTFKYYASGHELVSLNLVEGKRIKLSFVVEPMNLQQFPMCYTFLDGIISNVFSYVETDEFENAPKPARLKINSNGGQINIYNIRVYNTALDEAAILNNFQATIGDLAERQENYLSNSIRDIEGNISLEDVEAGTYNLQIPYVKITGGYQANKKFGLTKKSSANVPSLPVGKKDYRAIDIEMFYPTAAQNSYFANYKNFSCITTYDDPSLNVLNAFDIKPLVAANMYAQGTSSLEYPVKNLRVKLLNSMFTVRPDIQPVELVTFKADFMESAGAHNTGAANYIDDLYGSVGMQTPGQKQFEDDEKAGTIVTCIKGHPCVIFWNPGIDENGNPILDENGQIDRSAKHYHYIGKYNFNLDKATPNPFGFMEDEDDIDFGHLHDENGEVKFEMDKNGKLVPVNSIHCFEFLDNNTAVCNFVSDEIAQSNESLKTEQERYYDTWYSIRKYDEEKEDDGSITLVPVYGWSIGFESRHPEDLLGEHDADSLWPLASWVNELYYDYSYTENEGLTYPKREYALARFKNEYQCYLDRSFLLAYYLITEVLLMADSRVKNMMIATWGPEPNRSTNGYYPLKMTPQYQYITERYEVATVFNSELTYYAYDAENDTYEQVKIDLESFNSDTFYTLNKVDPPEIATDKEGKPIIISESWEPDTTQEKIITNNYIFYPIFYDMDTMLGLDNVGVVNKFYYDEDTNEDVFNGDEALWKLVRDALPEDLVQMYNTIEQSDSKPFNADNIIPYFNENQATMANETFYNEDAFYKYIDTFRKGYTDHLHDKVINPGEGERLYAAQGNRAMMREFFIQNRINYLRGKYHSDTYQSGDRIEFRLTYPKEIVAGGSYELTDSDKRVNASIKAVPPSGNFHFKSAKTGFAGVKIGANSEPTNHRFVDEEEYTIKMDASRGNGTETYLLGVSNLADVGDLSDKYLYMLIVGTSQNNLKKLILGNHHKDYYNPYWTSANINLRGFRFLEEFSLENCDTFDGAVNFAGGVDYPEGSTVGIPYEGAPLIKKVILTGSSARSVSLPVGGILEEVRIPSTVNTLTIDSHPTLKDENFTIGYFQYDDKSEGEEGYGLTGHYVNNYNSLAHVFFRDVPGIDTYKIARGALLRFEGTAPEDGQFVRATDFNADIEYYVLDSNSTFRKSAIQPTEDTFAFGEYYIPRPILLESYCFQNVNWEITDSNDVEYHEDGSISGIKVVDILSTLIPHSNINNNKVEALTGTLKLSLPGKTISEFDIYRKYNKIYPNLTITYDKDVMDLKPAAEINFYNTEEISSVTEPYFTVLSNGSYNLIELTSGGELTDTALQDPVKIPTPTQSYTFAYLWKDELNNYYLSNNSGYVRQTIANVDEITTSGILYETAEGEEYIFRNGVLKVTSFERAVPKESMKLVPLFDESVRIYKISFFDETGKEYADSTNGPLNYTYHQHIYDNKTAPLYLIKENDETKDNNMRYPFLGWISRTDWTKENPNPTYLDIEKYQIVQDTEFFARFGPIEDAATTYLDSKYFLYENKTAKYPRRFYKSPPMGLIPPFGNDGITDNLYYEEDEITFTGMAVSLNQRYLPWLKGKITLPNKTPGGEKIIMVNDFADGKFSEVYFVDSNDCAYKGIGIDGNNDGFYNCQLMKKIKMPVTLQYIGPGAFYFNYALTNIEWSPYIEFIGDRAFRNGRDLALTTLPETITYIGQEAFFGNNNLQLTNLPSQMTQILPKTFGQCEKLAIGTLGRDVNRNELGALENNIVYIGSEAFTTNNSRGISELYLKNSIKTFGARCFSNFGNTRGLTVYDETGMLEDIYEVDDMSKPLKDYLFPGVSLTVIQ